MQVGESILVHSYKYDGRLHRVWPARLFRLEGPLIVVEGSFGEEVEHPLLGLIKAGTLSTEFFWTDRWYSVFRFREPSGELRNFYFNSSATLKRPSAQMLELAAHMSEEF